LRAFQNSNLTARQFRYWLQQSISPELPVQQLFRALALPEILVPHLDAAIAHFCRAADAMRARLKVENGVPRLDFGEDWSPLEHVQLAPAATDQEALDNWAGTRWFRFDAGDLLFRHALFRTHDGRAIWAYSGSHLICDGRSSELYYRSVVASMGALSRGEPLPVLDFLSFERNMAEERARDSSSDPLVLSRHWRSWTEERTTPFSIFGITPDQRATMRLRAVQNFSKATVDRLYDLAEHGPFFNRSVEATVANFMTAFLTTLVWRLGGPVTQMIGVPFHGRTKDEEKLVGFKSEVLPMHVTVNPDGTFAEHVIHVHQSAREVLKRRGISIANPVHTPAFHISQNFSFQRHQANSHGESIKRIEVIRRSAAPESIGALQNGSVEGDGGLRYILTLHPDVLEFAELDRIGDGYHRALLQILDNPLIRVRDIEFVDPLSRQYFQSREHARTGFDQSAAATSGWISTWRTSIDRIGASPAIVHGESVLTHAALHDAASRWAGLLTTCGIQRGDRIGVYAESSNTLSAAWLGLTSIGAVYVPIHRATPEAQVQQLLRTCEVKLILCDPGCEARLAGSGIDTIPLEPGSIADSTPQPLSDPDPTDEAHIFHTSGSTGTPKAILVRHAALNASMDGWISANGLRGGEKILHFYAITFDPWLTGLIPALRLGGTCVVEPQNRPPSRARLLQLLLQHSITTLCTPTAYFHATCDMVLPPSVNRWVVGGEALAADKANSFLARQSGTRLINAYGPTETTIWACIHDVSSQKSDRMPLGPPFATCGFRVADAWGNYTPFGVPGELWISGPQLAQGYVGQPELTARQFVEHDGQRWYRTGDLVRWRKDGNLDFLGRIDRQVQVRGHRVEPAEIEIALRALPGIREALVIPVARDNTTALCGYFIPADKAVPDDTTLRSVLLRSLPEYKIPKWLIAVEAFPQSRNGKVDPSQLPVPERIERATVPDRLPSLTLWDLRFIFEEVLGLTRVGIDESFFDLGGDSLRLVELLATIEKRFGKALDATTVMAHPTYGGLAPLLEQERSAPAELIVELRKGSAPPLFCIPGAGGIGVEFYPLARRLPDDQPVIVLRSSGTDGHSHPPTSVDALLDEHVRHILRHREDHGENRPVLLMGYSLGGIFAWEVAQKLKSRNIPVDHVFLIDAHVATASGRALLQRPAKEVKAGLRERISDLVKGRPQEDERLSLAAELEDARQQGRIMAAASLGRYNLLVQAGFYKDIHSQPADFRTTYFLAANGPRRQHADAWKELAPNLTVHTINGDHAGDNAITREPQVEELVKVLTSALSS
jgi:amino acid adenylation domain-containing protein